MALTLSIPPDLEQKLRKLADSTGQHLDALILEAVREMLEPKPSFREIFAPLHEAFAQQQISEENLGATFNEARDEVWRARQTRKASP
jgi:hypothetical protein